MNMKFLSDVTPPTYIYHGSSTRNKFWEDKFAPGRMISCRRENVRKHREINNGEQYIILDIYLDLGCMYKREFTS